MGRIRKKGLYIVDLENDSKDIDSKDISEDEINNLLSNLKIMAPGKKYAMGVSIPYIIYDYINNNTRICSVELFVHNLPSSHFKIKLT